MAPFYKATCAMLGWSVDSALLATMEASNAAELVKLSEAVKAAQEHEGESEVCAAMLARAEVLMRVGEKEKALEAFEETYAKTVGLGPKLDLLLTKLRLCLFFDDKKLTSATIDAAKGLLEEGTSLIYGLKYHPQLALWPAGLLPVVCSYAMAYAHFTLYEPSPGVYCWDIPPVFHLQCHISPVSK